MTDDLRMVMIPKEYYYHEKAYVERLQKLLAEAGEALGGIDTFAWSSMRPDCEEAREECMRRIEQCRAVLARIKVDD